MTLVCKHTFLAFTFHASYNTSHAHYLGSKCAYCLYINAAYMQKKLSICDFNIHAYAGVAVKI